MLVGVGVPDELKPAGVPVAPPPGRVRVIEGVPVALPSTGAVDTGVRETVMPNFDANNVGVHDGEVLGVIGP